VSDKPIVGRIEQLTNDKSNVIQQAEIQAQEARTQKSIVLSILKTLGLPLRDYEAIILVSNKFNEQQEEILRLQGELEELIDENAHLKTKLYSQGIKFD